MNKKQKLNKIIKYMAWKALGAFVFVAVAGTSFWALAAFTEPSTTPGNSVQDFAKNIMGANNSDNAFDSGDVVANSDGSIVERLESLENKVDNEYSSCFTMTMETTSTTTRPSCPSEFISVADWYFFKRYSSGNIYLSHRTCCLPR